MAKVSSGGPPRHVGVEHLVLDSEFDPTNPCDEEHAWIAVALHGVEDAWVRGVVARHFAGSAFRDGPRARLVTVEDCRCEQPVSEPGSYRRQSFLVEGQQERLLANGGGVGHTFIGCGDYLRTLGRARPPTALPV